MNENEVIGHFASNLGQLNKMNLFEAKSSSRSVRRSSFRSKYRTSNGLTLKMVFGIFSLLIFHIFPVQAQQYDLQNKCNVGRYTSINALMEEQRGISERPYRYSELVQIPDRASSPILVPQPAVQQPAVQQPAEQPSEPVDLVKYDASPNAISSLTLIMFFSSYFKTAFTFLKNVAAFNRYSDGIIKNGAVGIIPQEMVHLIQIFGRFLPLSIFLCKTDKTETCKISRTGTNNLTLDVTYGGKRRSTLRRRAR